MKQIIKKPTWPVYAQDEIDAVERVLRSGKVNYWTGEEGRNFENEFASYVGVKHGIAVANGTLALELALRVLGIGPGDEVIVTPRSFFASASCIVQVGATPVFADVDIESQNITVDTIQAVLTERTAAIIAVHLAGWPCDMPKIMALAEQHGIRVIEDCAQAHGATIDGRAVGSFGDLAAFSFCQDKIMSTAGEGGMLLTNDSEWWSKAWSYKDHGKSWHKIFERDHPPGFRWVHDSFGSNWRLTELQAAIGRIQLRKLEGWSDRRRENAKYFTKALSDLAAVTISRPPTNFEHANYVYYLFVDNSLLQRNWNRDRILQSLIEEGLPGHSGSCPEIYREAAFSDKSISELPTAKLLGEQSIMLPVHPGVSKSFMDSIIQSLSRLIDQATRSNRAINT